MTTFRPRGPPYEWLAGSSSRYASTSTIVPPTPSAESVREKDESLAATRELEACVPGPVPGRGQKARALSDLRSVRQTGHLDAVPPKGRDELLGVLGARLAASFRELERRVEDEDVRL